MPPLQLPPPTQFHLHSIRPLQVPSDPPTADDVVRAALNAELVWGSHKIGHQISDEEACAALVYNASILSARAANDDPAVAPPWFQAGMDRIDTRLDRIDARLDRVNARLDQIGARLNRVERMAAFSLNRAALDGPMRPFLEVPFPDGTSPTVDHNLPLLDSLEAAQTMHHTQLKSYHRHYCPMREGVNGWLERDTRIREVLKEIGYDH